MGIRDRTARRLIATCLAGVLLAGAGVIAPTPASAKGPKPAELTMTAAFVSTKVDNTPCGLRLTAGYTGGKGKYTLVYELVYFKGETYGSAGPQSRTIRRSASPITILPTNLQPQGPNADTLLRYSGELVDGKGTVTTFPAQDIALVNCS